MKVTKHFVVTYTALYQKFEFDITADDDLPSANGDEAAALFAQLVSGMEADVEKYAADHEDFRLVMLARQEELEAFKKKMQRLGKYPT